MSGVFAEQPTQYSFDIAKGIDFGDLAPIQVPITIRKVKWILLEASGDAATRFKNANMAAGRFSPDGQRISLVGLADSEPLLVSLCLYKADKDGNLPVDAQGNADPRARASIEFVKAQPNKFQRQLFDIIKEISPDLDETPTIESIDKQIAKLQEMRAKLVSSQKAAAAQKNGDGEHGESEKNSGTASSSTEASSS